MGNKVIAAATPADGIDVSTSLGGEKVIAGASFSLAIVHPKAPERIWAKDSMLPPKEDELQNVFNVQAYQLSWQSKENIVYKHLLSLQETKISGVYWFWRRAWDLLTLQIWISGSKRKPPY